jgi:hypothetical protein
MGNYVLKQNVGYARPIALALSKPEFLSSALRIAVEAIRSFFFPQFENALLRRRPVANVDHPLDAAIPFDPAYIKKYLEFVKLWMSTFYKFWRLYGPSALPGLLRFLGGIRRLYAEAGMVYGVVHTTTTRPSKNYNLRFAIIHAMDPHLNCVPSLHVLLVVANWILASALAEELGLGAAKGCSEAEVEAWLASLYAEALAITESVLFVKQHSVNCIGASLFYLKRRFPAFGQAEAEAFVRELFASRDHGLEDPEALRRVMLEICASMDASFESRPEEGWMGIILEFIYGNPLDRERKL